MGKVIGTIAAVAVGVGTFIATGNPALAVAAFSLTSSVTGALAGTPKVPAATISRLTLTFDPNAPRKICFGWGAMTSDVEYLP